MADWVDRTRSLAVQLNCSISCTCSFLDAQFKEIPRSDISAHSGSNSLPAYMCVMFEPRSRHILLTFLIQSSMLFTFRFLIILPVENTICQDMVFMKFNAIGVHQVTAQGDFLVSIKDPLGGIWYYDSFYIMDSVVDFLPYKCGTLGPQMSSVNLKSSCRIGIFCRMLLSTACSIRFTGCPVMRWNCLAPPAIFT